MINMNKIVIIGSSNTDMVIQSDHLPEPGETIIGRDFFMNRGGKGANQAVAVARMGGDAYFICKVGNDTFGKDALKLLQKEGIDVSYSSVCSDKPSGVALINIDKEGENTIAVAPGANSTLSVDDIQHAEPVIQSASIVLMQLESPIETLIYAAKVAKHYGVQVVLNPAPAPKEGLPKELLENVDILIPNATEAKIISGIEIKEKASAKQAISNIMAKGVKAVVVTIGAHGALLYENGELINIPAFHVHPVDTTAAGDTFCGALCVALSNHYSLKEAVGFANKASSISVTRKGAQTSIPFAKELC